MTLEHDPTTETLSLGSDDERGLPKQPKKPPVANPSTPGVQPPNKPDGRDAPPAQTQTRDAAELDDEPPSEAWIEERRRPHRAARPTGEASQAFAAGIEHQDELADRRDAAERRQLRLRETTWRARIGRAGRTPTGARRRGSSRQARPARRTRRAAARSPGRLGDDDSSPRPLTPPERDYLRAEIDRRRRHRLHRERALRFELEPRPRRPRA